MKNSILKYQLIFLALLLAIPAVFRVFHLAASPLNGYKEAYEKPPLTWAGWLDGSFQVRAENYASQEFGLRSQIIRFNNEWQYRLFRKANASDVVVMKHGYLNSRVYIESFLGKNYIGDADVEKRSSRLFALQQQLKSINKELIVIIAPGKASYYSEYIPARYFPANSKNNYRELRKAYLAHGVQLLDFNQLFLGMKDTSRYVLYPKTGIHWSEYGQALMADTLISYVEQLTGKDLPDLKITHLELSPVPKGTDDDIEKSLNLLCRIPNDTLAYPSVAFDTVGKDRLRLLVVGDSFYWQMYGMGLSREAFGDGQFLYYGREINPRPTVGPVETTDMDLAALMGSYDGLVLMATESNLADFAWGFDRRLLEALQAGE
ncbi:MAG: hypothetical protein R2830_04145 [Saprospiraceae bacterium]